MGGCSKPGSGVVGVVAVAAEGRHSLVVVGQVGIAVPAHPGLFGLVGIAKFADELELVVDFRIFPSAELACPSAGLAFGLVSEEALIKKNYQQHLL